MLRRLGTNKKSLVIIPVALALALTWLFLPVKEVSIEPYGTLSLESRIVITTGYQAAYAASTIALYPGTIVTIMVAPYDDFDWLTPANVGADDGAYAQITDDNFDNLVFSYRLDATDFGFDIPNGATIDGIVIEFERSNTKTDDALVQLITWGTPSGNNNSVGATWLVNDTIATFGSSTDKWGLTWTVDDINASNFGVAVACVGNANNADPQIDFLRIIVHYTPLTPDILNEPTSKAFGTVTTSTDYWSTVTNPPEWPLDDDECYFTVTNNSSQAVDIAIKSTDFTGGGGWTLAGTPAADTVTLKAGKSGDALETNMVTLTTSDQAFITALGASLPKKWELKMETPTSFGDGVAKQSIITLTATF